MCADVAVKDVLVTKRLAAVGALVHVRPVVQVHVHSDVVPACVHLVADQADVLGGRVALLVHHELLLLLTGRGGTRQVERQAPGEGVADLGLLLHLHALTRTALDHQVVLHLLLHHVLTIIPQSIVLPSTVDREDVQPEFFCSGELLGTKGADDHIGPRASSDGHSHGHLPVATNRPFLKEDLVPLAGGGVGAGRRCCQDAHDEVALASATCESLPLEGWIDGRRACARTGNQEGESPLYYTTAQAPTGESSLSPVGGRSGRGRDNLQSLHATTEAGGGRWRHIGAVAQQHHRQRIMQNLNNNIM